MSSKAPTTLLLNPDKTFLAFGYGAENIFMEMTSENESLESDSDSDSDSQEKTENKTNKKWEEYYYFNRFKMLLHEDTVRIFKLI